MRVTTQKGAIHTVTETGFIEGIHFTNEKKIFMSHISLLWYTKGSLKSNCNLEMIINEDCPCALHGHSIAAYIATSVSLNVFSKI